jgi:G3E family GTPase
MTPITILTGFLGSGKTTLLNQIIKQNPDIRFGLIVNEFGEIGIDGQLIEDSGEEMIEISNGCVCCVVRKDLQDTVSKLLDSGRVDYIIVETSGLAEPAPVAQTFAMDDLDGRVNLDAVICLVDALNYEVTEKNYRIALEQMAFADIIVLNKIQDQKESEVNLLKDLIKKTNPEAALIENNNDINTSLLIDTGVWTIDKLTGIEDDEDHEHEDHHHEHDDVDEVVFTTEKILEPGKLDEWLQTKFPENVIRAKGFLRLQTTKGESMFLFQMVGAGKSLKPFVPTRKDFDYQNSRIVLIGKGLDEAQILADLDNTTV